MFRVREISGNNSHYSRINPSVRHVMYHLNQSRKSWQSVSASFVGLVTVLSRLLDRHDNFTSSLRATRYMLAPVGKVDVMLATRCPTAAMIGAGTYLAFQSSRFGRQRPAVNINQYLTRRHRHQWPLQIDETRSLTGNFSISRMPWCRYGCLSTNTRYDNHLQRSRLSRTTSVFRPI